MSLDGPGRRIEVLIDLDRFDQAERECRELLTLDPDNYTARYSLVRCLQKSRRLDEGLEQSSALVQLYPDNAWVHYLHSYQLLLMGRKAEAIQSSRQAVECDPQDGFFRGVLSAQLWSSEQSKEAMKVAEQALELDVVQTEALLVRSLVFMQRGQLEAAEQVVRLLLNQQPENLIATHALATICFYQGRFGEAEQLLLEILQSEPGSRRDTYQHNLELMIRHHYLPFACWQRAKLILWHLVRMRLFLTVQGGRPSDHLQQVLTIVTLMASIALAFWGSVQWMNALPLVLVLILSSEHVSLSVVCVNPILRKRVQRETLDGYTLLALGWALCLLVVLLAIIPQLEGLAFLNPLLFFLLAPFCSVLAIDKAHSLALRDRFAMTGLVQFLILLSLLPLSLLCYLSSWGVGLIALLSALYLLPVPPTFVYLAARYTWELPKPEAPKAFILS